MTITTKDSKEFVYKYIKLLQGNFGFTDREVLVVAAIVHRFMVLSEAKKKLTTKAKDTYDPYAEWRKPESIRDIYTSLNMTIDVFRHNLIRLKSKGVFFQGQINETLIPESLKSTTITVINGDTE